MDQEERAQQQALRYAHDMAVMKDQLAETESVKNSLQNEVLCPFYPQSSSLLLVHLITVAHNYLCWNHNFREVVKVENKFGRNGCLY